MAIDAKLAERLDNEIETDLGTEGRLGKVRRYLKGEHDLPYMPRGAKAEYKHLAEKSITNWTPLLSDTYNKGLWIDGYRSARASENAEAWSYWQDNGLDARQSIVHRGALNYGTSYALVLPGTVKSRRSPYWRPQSPLTCTAWYKDDDDDFPEVGYRRVGTTMDGTRLIEVLDKQSVYTFALPSAQDSSWVLSKVEDHGLGVTPLIRYRDRLDDEAQGIIRPVLNLQDRVNEIVFTTLIALQYASFRQRWATGLAIPTNDDGEPVEPFQAAVDRLWVSEDDTAKFGDFAQTELSGHHSAYELTIKTMAAIAQVSPNILTGELVNISAEALAQMESSTQRKLGEYQTIFGESWELGFHLAAKAAGSRIAPDSGAQVRWRDTEARSFAQTVDGLGKIAQMLQAPVEGLWEHIPGITDADIERWKELREETDVLGELVGEISRQSGSATTATQAESDAADVKAKADAMGVLIRSGVSAESAASQVGLQGVQFTGAVPTSLRLPETDAETLEGGA